MSFSRSDLSTVVIAAGYADNAEHLRDEIDWLRRLIAGEVRASAPAGGVDEFAGLCISRDEVERYLDEGSAAERSLRRPARELAAELAAIRSTIECRIRESMAAGVDLRFERLTRAFELDAVGRAALLCVAAPEIDPQIGRVFAYLQNDATRKRPSCGQVARLVAPIGGDSTRVWQLFGPGSPLLAGPLIDAGRETADTPLPAREVRLAAGLVEFLLGIDALPSAIAHAARLVESPEPLPGFAYYHRHRAIVDELAACWRAGGRLPVAYVAGPAGAGRHLIASALAAAEGKRVLAVQWPILRPSGALAEAARLVGREARLHDALVLIEDADDGPDDGAADRATAHALDAFVNGIDADIVAVGTVAPAEFRHLTRVRAAGFELPYPSADERSEIWRSHLATVAPDVPPLDVCGEALALAQKFSFTPEQIGRAFRAAALAAPRDAAGRPRLTSGDLHARSRDEAQKGLHRFCHRVVPRFGWDDIVLAPDTRAQLEEICHWVRHRTRVYDAWGFGPRLGAAGGVTVLLSGASGTGKTMSAEIIAADLQLELYRVDLSRIVSKYIGETERNLSRIFEQSAVSNCVLFFDEADALFGKRTEVKDAHDRYANIEVNYLLSEMERSEGVIVVATNIKGNLDPAFIRRFSHVIEYPVPGERLREQIWARAFPPHMPRSGDLDFGFLAQRFNLAGGHIRNIALGSAFMAAAGGGEIGMEHVIRATKREYQKIGRVCSKSDFGEYYNLVREVDPS